LARKSTKEKNDGKEFLQTLKELAYEISLENGEKFHIAAVCKGAGMINPALATMLCFVLTDAKIPRADMDELLKKAAEQSKK